MNIGGEVDEILSCLPVKSLKRFQVVCKDWKFHIQSNYFKAKHLKNQKTKAKTLIYHNQGGDQCDFVVSICNEEENDDSGTSFYEHQKYYIKDLAIDYMKIFGDGPFCTYLAQPHILTYAASLGTSMLNYFACVKLVATVNGLVCLDHSVFSLTPFWDTYNRIITLWNPATRDLKTLPSWEPQCKPELYVPKIRRSCDHIGFGFHSTSNDYKVIRLVHHTQKEFISQAAIYSLNTNSWRELDYSTVSTKISRVSTYGTTIYLGQKVYWLILSYDMLNNKLLLSFDMGKEEFQITPLPSEYKTLPTKYLYMATEFLTLHDSVALVFYGFIIDDVIDTTTIQPTLAIWITKDLGQECASWIKVLDFGHVSGISRPLGFRKCKNSDDYLFLFTRWIKKTSKTNKTDMDMMKGIYMNNQGEIKNDRMMPIIKVDNNIDFPFNLVNYVETLVSVNRS